MIRKLFAIERISTQHQDSAEQRKARRQQHSAPALDKLRLWITQQRETVPPKTPLGRALGYLHRQWSRLLLFLQDGRIELTNNRVERELRRLVLGRKNWLFATEDIGGQRTASILTIVGTCIAQRINPRAYLHLAAKLLVQGWPNSRLRDLLPDRIAQAHPELRLPEPRPLLPDQDGPAALPAPA